MPPMCNICEKDFNASEGGLVYFTETPREKEENKRFNEPGFVGHPSNAVWFCPEHYKLANPLSDLTRAEAMLQLKTALEKEKGSQKDNL